MVNTGSVIEFYVEKLPETNTTVSKVRITIKILHIAIKYEKRVREYVLTHIWLTSRKFASETKSEGITALVLRTMHSFRLFTLNIFRDLPA